jgi:hypothetical protein
MREKLGGDPPGQVVAAEEPDVLVVMGGHRVGIEVTELHQRPTLGQGPRRVQESERSSVAVRAQGLAATSGVPVVNVALHFNDAALIAERDRETIANRLVDLVSNNLPQIGGSTVLKLWHQPGNQLPWIRTVRIYRAEFLKKHHWAVPDSGWVQTEFVRSMKKAASMRVIGNTATSAGFLSLPMAAARLGCSSLLRQQSATCTSRRLVERS